MRIIKRESIFFICALIVLTIINFCVKEVAIHIGAKHIIIFLLVEGGIEIVYDCIMCVLDGGLCMYRCNSMNDVCAHINDSKKYRNFCVVLKLATFFSAYYLFLHNTDFMIQNIILIIMFIYLTMNNSFIIDFYYRYSFVNDYYMGQLNLFHHYENQFEKTHGIFLEQIESRKNRLLSEEKGFCRRFKTKRDYSTKKMKFKKQNGEPFLRFDYHMKWATGIVSVVCGKHFFDSWFNVKKNKVTKLEESIKTISEKDKWLSSEMDIRNSIDELEKMNESFINDSNFEASKVEEYMGGLKENAESRRRERIKFIKKNWRKIV